MRFLLRPGWLVFVAVVLAFVVACYALLAPWQFGRETQREAETAAIAAANAAPAVPVGDLLPSGGSVTPDVEWRRVTVTGTFLPDAEAVVRLRLVDGGPAVEVVTPLRTDDGRVLLVDRGSVSTGGGTAVPEFDPAPTGEVTLEARLRVSQNDPEERGVVDYAGVRQTYAVDPEPLAAATGLPIEDGWLQLAEDQPGVLNPLPVSPSTGGAPFTNRSYALQWITFGLIALLALGYFIRLEMHQRSGKKERDRTALRRALAGDDEAPPPDDQRPTP